MDKIEEYNKGKAAGKHSGMFNLGTEGEPVEITPDNILDLFVDMEAVNEEDKHLFNISKTDVKFIMTRYEVDEHGEKRIVQSCFRMNLWQKGR